MYYVGAVRRLPRRMTGCSSEIDGPMPSAPTIHFMLLESPETKPDVKTKTEEKKENVYKCAVCQTKITKDKYLCAVNSDSPFQSFMNPGGFYFDVITFLECESIIDVPGASFEHTWFHGYAWRIIGCAKCSQHLGWSFESAAKKPPRFYGLIRDRLVCS